MASSDVGELICLASLPKNILKKRSMMKEFPTSEGVSSSINNYKIPRPISLPIFLL